MKALNRAWRRLRIRRERALRKALGVPRRHPELLTGSDAEALSAFFLALAADMEADGLGAADIILDERRRQGQ